MHYRGVALARGALYFFSLRLNESYFGRGSVSQMDILNKSVGLSSAGITRFHGRLQASDGRAVVQRKFFILYIFIYF